MAISGDFRYESLLDPSLLADLETQGSSFDEMYPFGVPEGESTDAPQANTTFDFDGFDIEQQATQGVDSGFTLPTTPRSSFPDQRYVPFPTQSQTYPGSVWRPIEQPTQQFHYPDPDFISQPQMTSTPYYPLPSANTMMPHNFAAITPPGQQFSSIERPMFVHGSLGAPAAEAENFPFDPIQTYQDDGAFTPEDLDFSVIPDDLVATAIREGWALSEETAKQDSRLDDLYIPDAGNDSDADASDSDREYKPSSSSSARPKPSSRRINKNRISKPSRPQATLANGEVKKGRPCAKPQTEERKRVNQRRMEGYYRRKNDQGNLERARLQSRESYWRRKQRRIEAGEKVRSYNPNKGRRE